MIWLWIAAALLSAALAVLVVQRAARAAKAGHGDNPALAVYRRQMAELDELAERGVLAEGERRSVRAETGRRLLAAAERTEAQINSSGPRLILIVAAAAPLAALAAYFVIGAPNYADQPFKARLAEWRGADQQSLSAPQIAAVERAVAAERPTDPRPLLQLALAEFASREPTEAVQALHRAIALTPREPILWEVLAEAQVSQNGGEADAEALDAFRHVLALDPANVNARYYLARARIAGGDAPGGLADWRALQPALPPTDPRRAVLDDNIRQVAATGKLPVAAQGSEAMRTPQIQAMVDGLAARLQSNPDDPAGWVRLVRAYTVLGETDRRDQALASAQRRYAGHPDILAQLEAARVAPASPSGNAQDKAPVSPQPGSP
jgi:cytochrome c-type biogenesis protein CcmH